MHQIYKHLEYPIYVGRNKMPPSTDWSTKDQTVLSTVLLQFHTAK